MTYARFNKLPFEQSLNNLVDELVTELPVFFKQPFNNYERKGFVPVNVQELETGYKMEVIAPGFEKADFRINLEQNLLTISAEAKEDKEASGAKWIRQEFKPAGFKRSFTLDDKIDATKIEASYINGVLALNLPHKTEVKQPATTITIQ